MALYKIGDKVTIQMNPNYYPSISKLNDHILTVKSTIDFGTEVLYSLRWEQKDNPGRSYDFFIINTVLWTEEELITCFNTSIVNTIKSTGLPDI